MEKIQDPRYDAIDLKVIKTIKQHYDDVIANPRFVGSINEAKKDRYRLISTALDGVIDAYSTDWNDLLPKDNLKNINDGDKG